MKKLMLLLLFCASAFSQPKQTKCKYWFVYLGRIAKWERAKLKAIQQGDEETAKYYGALIRRDIRDLNDDYEEENGEQ